MTSKQHPSLKAMAEAHLPGVKKQTTFQVDPRLVKFEPGFNGRIETSSLRAHIDAMKTALRNGAVFPPLDLRVEDGQIFAVDGHCRTTAAVEVIEEDGVEILLDARHYKGSDVDRVAHMLTTSQGRGLTGLEQGHVFLRLRRFGVTVKDICNRSGKSDTHVEQMMMLATAPKALQDMLAQEQVAAATAVDAILKHGEKQATEILQAALQKQLEAGHPAKVTKKHLSTGPTFSRATVSHMVSSLDTFYSRLSSKNRDELATVFDQNEQELEGKMVTLPAASLKVLLDAHSMVAEERNRHKQRELKKAKKPEQKAS